jgi:hypothetical protein
MNLDIDKRSIGDFENNVEWDALNILYKEALNSVGEGIKLTNNLLNENADDMVKDGIDIDTIKGVALSFKDIKTEVENTKTLHSNRTGKVNTDNFEDYNKYLEIASKYQTLVEETATLISSAYMDVLNTAVMKSESKEVREVAKEAMDSFQETINEVKEEELKQIEDKLDGK